MRVRPVGWPGTSPVHSVGPAFGLKPPPQSSSENDDDRRRNHQQACTQPSRRSSRTTTRKRRAGLRTSTGPPARQYVCVCACVCVVRRRRTRCAGARPQHLATRTSGTARTPRQPGAGADQTRANHHHAPARVSGRVYSIVGVRAGYSSSSSAGVSGGFLAAGAPETNNSSTVCGAPARTAHQCRNNLCELAGE